MLLHKSVSENICRLIPKTSLLAVVRRHIVIFRPVVAEKAAKYDIVANAFLTKPRKNMLTNLYIP